MKQLGITIILGCSVKGVQSVNVCMSKISLFIGLIAFAIGGAGVLGYSLPLIPTIMILIGLFILAEAIRKLIR